MSSAQKLSDERGYAFAFRRQAMSPKIKKHKPPLAPLLAYSLEL